MKILVGLICGMLLGCSTIQNTLNDYQVVGIHPQLWQDGKSGWTPALPANEKGQPRVNRNVLGNEFEVDGMVFVKGIGLAGDSSLIYLPQGSAANIEALVGIDDNSPNLQAKSEIIVYGDNQELKRLKIYKGDAPQKLMVRLIGVYQVRIEVKSGKDSYTNIIRPRMSGLTGLRAKLEQGRRTYRNMMYVAPVVLKKAQKLPNGSIIFSQKSEVYGNCIGLSNRFVTIIIAPEKNGKIIHFGPNLTENHLGGVVTFKAEGEVEQDKPWKWRVAPDGRLVMLSGYDLFKGIRWSYSLKLYPKEPVVNLELKMKNIMDYGVSWTMSTEISGDKNTSFIMDKEVDIPGYTLLQGRDNGIVVGDRFILFSYNKNNKTPVVMGTKSASWAMANSENRLMLIKAEEPLAGYYPYKGLRVMGTQKNKDLKVQIFSEKSPLHGGEFVIQEQNWSLGEYTENMEKSIAILKNNILKAKKAERDSKPTPTGRTNH